jgi:HAD superfamily hydrolase (TIGR01509 family)
MNTVHALARRKSEVLVRRLEREGVVALAGARRYLECAGHLGLDRAVLSASVRTAEMIERAGLTSLVEATVDADRMALEQLRSRPEPDMLVSVCARFDVEPGAVVAFTSTPVGITAGRAAGVRTIGVGAGDEGESLARAGADRVVGSLVALLDARLAAGL